MQEQDLVGAAARQREIAVRTALGAGRSRLVRQLLTESLVLAALGGIVGVAAAQWGGAVLRALFLPDEPAGVVTDTRTLGVALVATLGAALLTGIVPAVAASRADLARSLAAASRDAGAVRSRTRTMLLVFQAALSVVLLIGAGLFMRSLENVRTMRLGYDVGPLSVVSFNLRGTKLSPAETNLLGARLVEAAHTVPGVAFVTPVASVPFWSNEGRALFIQGIDSVRKLGRFILQAGDTNYFRATGTRILRGRGFTAADVGAQGGVVVVGDGMAKILWPVAGQAVHLRHHFGAALEAIGHDCHRGNAAALGFDGVVQTARRAAPSVADAGDDRVGGAQLTEQLRRDRLTRVWLPPPDDFAKIGTARFYDHVADILTSRFGVREVIRRRKPDSSRPVSPELLGELSAADAIVSGIGD